MAKAVPQASATLAGGFRTDSPRALSKPRPLPTNLPAKTFLSCTFTPSVVSQRAWVPCSFKEAAFLLPGSCLGNEAGHVEDG